MEKVAATVGVSPSGSERVTLAARAHAPDTIRSRQVFFLQGYDPQGAAGFYRLLRREWQRNNTTWPTAGSIGPLEYDSDEIAHCMLAESGPHGSVETRYEFLRLEQFVCPNMAQPLWRQFARAARWMADDIISGALLRAFRASWKIGVLLIYSQVFLIIWLALAITGGVVAALAAARFGQTSAPLTIIIAAAAAAAVFLALRPLAKAMYVIQLNNCWPYLREMARGAPTSCDHMIEVFATRLVAAARTDTVDEILIVAHSAGGMTGLSVLARALELDPQLGQHGTRIVLMTVGSVIPALAMHPAADKLRSEVRRIALEPTVLWVDCQAREDFMNFWNFDPVAGSGVDVGPERCNPRIWHVRFVDMLSPQTYQRVRSNYFRMHFQYIMANDRPASYDYFKFVCGHVPFAKSLEGSGDIAA